ncbi:MAG TPA: ACP S-malonyltransferase [Microbacteriaceae bacterium]|nr:ACP S-malonyltransferase [Microbacteriaceae bacterium]
MIIIACPGQGSQTPGFLKDWIDDAESIKLLEKLSEASGIDLIKHGTESDADTIRDTAIAQPLIVAASLLAWQALTRATDTSAVGVAGHSVGEFAAASIAGILSPDDALRLVGVRGRAMAEAATKEATSMSAVVGGDPDDVIAKIEELGLTPANRNGGGQIVAAGRVEQLRVLKEEAPRGTRVIPLQVAGAFHTSFMASAIPKLEHASNKVIAKDPALKIWTNASGRIVSSGQEYLSLLVSQIAQPVRWDLCMSSFQEAEIKGMIELTPAGALTGIAKRGLRGTPTVAVKAPSDIESAVKLLSETNS